MQLEKQNTKEKRIMSEQCTHDCATCGEACGERTEPMDFTAKPHELSHIKKVIGIVSGKGGVGKSLVTSLLAVLMNRNGHSTAIMDADVTGPSIPRIFGLDSKATANEDGLLPVKSKTGVSVMSLNLLLENETDPVVWRGPVIANAVRQFWTDVIWGDVDYMFIDMPPGTGDVPLTVFQSIAVDGIIIVTSPQELVSMIVTKAANMAKMMNIPILGIVENMSYVTCPDCGREIRLFGESHLEKIAGENGIKTIASLPVDPRIAAACDRGLIELFEGNWLDGIAEMLEGLK
jgi:Mrp family chromosome partitioning ATPase